MSPSVADLQRQHAAAMDRLYDAVARYRGFASLDAVPGERTKVALIGYATRLCKEWSKYHDLRLCGVRDPDVVRFVAEQYGLAQEIAAAEARLQGMG